MAKSKSPKVRIASKRGQSFSLPHTGTPGLGGRFEVDEDGFVHAIVDDIQTVKDEEGEREVKVGRKRAELPAEQAESIVRLHQLDGATLES